MSPDDIIQAMRSDPVLARKVLAGLRVAGPWRRRKSPMRGGCDEWERCDLVTGRPVVEIYHAEWMGEWGVGDYGNYIIEELGQPTLKQAKAAADGIARKRGWSVSP